MFKTTVEKIIRDIETKGAWLGWVNPRNSYPKMVTFTKHEDVHRAVTESGGHVQFFDRPGAYPNN